MASVCELSKDSLTLFISDSLPNNGYEPPEPVWQMAFGDKAIQELKKTAYWKINRKKARR
jgi:hypothetical protein